jgi:NAD(P)-dependent dehydrogenase (short-subunit alcohol dehydrogenase family)
MSARRLQGKVAIVTGGGKGIGSATCIMMAKEGASVAIADIDGVASSDLARQIERDGGTAAGYEVDVADMDQVRTLIDNVVSRFGRIDVLHCNAAAMGKDIVGVDSQCDIVDLPLEVWHRTLAVNLTGPMLCSRFAIPRMLDHGGGSIIFTSSVAAKLAEHVRGAYAVSKTGLTALTQHIAAAYGKRGVRCNAVAPGRTVTDPTRHPPERDEMLLRHHLTPFLGQPDDIARVAVFLASDDSRYITGQVIFADGGFAAHLATYADDIGN